MIKEALLKKLEGDVAVAEADLRTFIIPNVLFISYFKGSMIEGCTLAKAAQ